MCVCSGLSEGPVTGKPGQPDAGLRSSAPFLGEKWLLLMTQISFSVDLASEL